MDVTIYFNPHCNTSRLVLSMIRSIGIEPTVIDYLRTPPSRGKLVELIEEMEIPARRLIRATRTPYGAGNTHDESLCDEQIIDIMIAHPALAYRPIVITPLGTKLCRPAETVFELLPTGAWAAFRGSSIVLPDPAGPSSVVTSPYRRNDS